MRAHNVKSNYSSLSFKINIASQFLVPEACMDGSLNNCLNIFPLFQVILHIKLLLHPLVWPFSLLRNCREHGLLPISKILTTKIIMEAPSRLCLKVQFLNLVEGLDIGFNALALNNTDKDS